MPLFIVRNDVTKVKADAIVNAANSHALIGGGVDRAIHAAAGLGLLRAREEIGDIAAGDAARHLRIFPARALRHPYRQPRLAGWLFPWPVPIYNEINENDGPQKREDRRFRLFGLKAGKQTNKEANLPSKA